MRRRAIVRTLCGLFALLVTMSGCTSRSERSSSAPPPSRDTLSDTTSAQPAVTPLSRAYPFVALAFALTPFLGALVFQEAVSARLIIGVLFVLCGLFFVVG